MDNNQQLNLPTGFEKMLFEGLVRSFFVGQTYYDSSGYMRTDPAPMGQVTQQIANKITPFLVEEISNQINIEELAKEIKTKIDIKSIEKEVVKEIKAKLKKKLAI